MATTTKLTDGFINFSSRDLGYRGDKGTWVRFNTATRRLTVQYAAKGTLSAAYRDELCDFLKPFGVDFCKLRPGERLDVTIPEDSSASDQEHLEGYGAPLTDCINALLTHDNAKKIILRNGAYVWDLYNLWEEVRRNEVAYTGNYINRDDGIYKLDTLGGLDSRVFEIYHCGWQGWPEVRATITQAAA